MSRQSTPSPAAIRVASAKPLPARATVCSSWIATSAAASAWGRWLISATRRSCSWGVIGDDRARLRLSRQWDGQFVKHSSGGAMHNPIRLTDSNGEMLGRLVNRLHLPRLGHGHGAMAITSDATALYQLFLRQPERSA